MLIGRRRFGLIDLGQNVISSSQYFFVQRVDQDSYSRASIRVARESVLVEEELIASLKCVNSVRVNCVERGINFVKVLMVWVSEHIRQTPHRGQRIGREKLNDVFLQLHLRGEYTVVSC